jgi:hypothetical protein
MRRRSWLKLGVGAAAVLALGGGAVALVTPGLAQGRLTPDARVVVRAVATGVLDGVLPSQAAQRGPALDALLARVDTLVGALPVHAQGELSQLLALLATGVGRRSLAGLGTAWPDASVAQVQAALQSMRTSSLALRQQSYLGLHDIVGAAYFSDPSTWGALGYPGPVEV